MFQKISKRNINRMIIFIEISLPVKIWHGNEILDHFHRDDQRDLYTALNILACYTPRLSLTRPTLELSEG